MFTIMKYVIEVCHNVAVEHHLQPLNGEGFHRLQPTLMKIHILIYVPGATVPSTYQQYTTDMKWSTGERG